MLNFVITMAGRSSRFFDSGYILPKYMIEIDGKTLFDYSLMSLPLDIADNIILIGLKEHDEKYQLLNFIMNSAKKLGIESKTEIKLIDCLTEGQAETALFSKEFVKDDDEILIYNIDTMFSSDTLRDNLLSKKSDGIFGAFLIGGQDPKWSFVKTDTNGNIIETAEKIQISNMASTGLYHFKRAGDFFAKVQERIDKKIKDKSEYYIAPIYNDMVACGKKFTIDFVKSFTPLGTPDDVNKFRELLLKKNGRYFNSFVYNKEKNSVIKKSLNQTKLLAELRWYLQLPHELKSYVPRILSYSEVLNDVFIEMEYYSYSNMSEMFINGKIDDLILQKLLGVLNKLREYRLPIKQNEFSRIYYDKTVERIELLKNNVYFNELLKSDVIKINGKEYKNIKQFDFAKIADRVGGTEKTIIHGDYFFANLLFDYQDNTLKMVDARGEFGEVGCYGDPRYDIAKLSHSIHGKYDFIVNDKIFVDGLEDGINFEIQGLLPEHTNLEKMFDKMVVDTGFDLQIIRIIEALLFISMIPYHKDYPNRQLVQFATGIKLLNEVI